MITYVTTQRLALLRWAHTKCLAFKDLEHDYRAIGFEVDGKLGAAMFYDAFRRGDCNLTVLIEDRRAVSRLSLRRAFQYPFAQINLRRVSACVNSRNVSSISLIERLGFVREGVRRAVYGSGADEIIYGMLREECRWLSNRDRLLDPHTAGAF